MVSLAVRALTELTLADIVPITEAIPRFECMKTTLSEAVVASESIDSFMTELTVSLACLIESATENMRPVLAASIPKDCTAAIPISSAGIHILDNRFFIRTCKGMQILCLYKISIPEEPNSLRVALCPASST